MAQGCAEISAGVQSSYGLKCFEDYVSGISALLDRAQWGEMGTVRETETDREGETRKTKDEEDV